MGSASSKAARASAAKSAKKPSWSGARIPAYDPKTPPKSTARRPCASEFKDEEIQRDGKDPQLMANLSRMEPVRVYHHMPPAGTEDHVRELFESRARAEDEAAGARTPRNRLHVGTLVALLEERQNENANANAIAGAGPTATATATTMTTRQLGEKYGMDVERVERLVRSVNVPSVREGGGGDADVVVTEVEWREPRTVA
ncbi:hypothetical protein BC827DRAFT_1168459 [Russula dissimulans]|nr:hypothetical protein BC827DRAFT_1168459 [Russula dissimulans]